jgi:RHS repeat-associated protein
MFTSVSCRALIFSFLFAVPLTAITVPGHTAGKFQVGESGEAIYSIPISTVAGTAGLEPKLALTYSSQGYNSLLGIGWSLSGLSAITRCPATLAQDGFMDPVDFDNNDRFCLDGERLMAIAGVYGANATEYRTEQDSFRRVVSYGEAGSGPASFTVKTKSGLIFEYGETADSRIEAQGKASALLWAVNRIADTKGNYLTVTYTEDAAEYRPNQIDYTGNDNAGLLPFASIKFVYESRPDVSPRYVSGSLLKTTRRLVAVQAFDGTQLYREYLLAYEASTISGYSRLISIKECGSDSTCFSPTTFSWPDSSGLGNYGEISGLVTGVSSNLQGAAIDISRIKFGDFNGDGLTDIYNISGWGSVPDLDYIYLSRGNGTYDVVNGIVTRVESNFSLAPLDIARIKFGDFNGDGRTDIYYVNGWGATPAQGTVYLSHGDGTYTTVSGIMSVVNSNVARATADLERIKFGDFNGDGRTDIYYVNGWESTALDDIFLSNGDGSYTRVDGLNTFVSSFNPLNTLNLINMGDFNGDGRTDIYYINPWGNFLNDVYLSNGNGTYVRVDGIVTPVNTSSGSAAAVDIARVKFGDFNADGMMDIYYVKGWESVEIDDVYLSKGDGTYFRVDGVNTFVSSANPMNTLNLIQLGDFNGDGRTDIYYIQPWGNFQNNVLLSRGDGTWAYVNGIVTPMNGADANILAIDIARVKFGDFNGDGKADIYFINGWGSTPDLDDIHLTLTKTDGLLGRVVTGHGHTTMVAYRPLTDPQIYDKGSEAAYPELDFQGPLYSVASFSSSDGSVHGGMATYSYRYSNARIDLSGRGFRGFERTDVTDAQTWIRTTVFYDRDHRCVNAKIRRTEQRQENDLLIGEVDNTISIQDHGFGVSFSFVSESTARSYELDGRLDSTVVTSSDVDFQGNVVELGMDYGGGLTENTANTFEDDLDNWLLGRLVRTEVTKTALGQATLTRTSAFTYDPVSGLLTSEVIEPDHPTLRLTKTYLHDAFGNISTSTIIGPGIADRNHTTSYTLDGRYVQNSANALGQAETKSQLLGNLASLVGPNLLTTTWSYDGFGRQTKELRADGTQTLTLYEACDEDCPAGAIYRVRSAATGAPASTSYFDLLDRLIRKETEGFGGSPIYIDTNFNNRGLVSRVSEPYFAGETPIWTVYQYDVFGRPLSESAPGNRVTTTDYDGRTTTVTNPLNQTNVRTVDARGQLISSSDNLSGTVTYAYDAFGNMVELEDPVGNTTTFTYNIRGHRTSIDDPDTGLSTFTYNTIGELKSQTDAKQNTVSFTYDLLGRLVTRIEPEGTSFWTYDTRPRGIGKLSQVNQGDYSEEYFYDSLGRVELTRFIIAGEVLAVNSGYDLMGRPDFLIYPSGYGVRTLYNDQGYAQELRRTSDNHALWKAQTINARGQLEEALLGNGVVTKRDFDPETGRVERIRAGSIQDLAFSFDDIGNLTSRADSLRGLTEAFLYDGLNRLTSSQVLGSSAVSVAYDEIGNIISKSDVGTYTYGENGAGPHAVTSIIGPRPATYSYDANGNLTQRQRLGSVNLLFADGFESGNTAAWSQSAPPPATLPATTIAYTSFNKPRSITQGTTNLTFAYGPDYSRYRQVVTSPTGVTAKLYAGGLFEREKTGTTTRDIHYIRAGGEVFAIYTAMHTGTATLQSTRYLHRDHLGSAQTISSEVGAVVEVLSFDPWGLRRNPQYWTAAESPIGSTIDRGFTGHEHLDEIDLIHMNGRVYDPVIGRFLSADPFIQSIDESQNLNRYSYVQNNPLSATDPSGYFLSGLRRFFSRILQNPIVRIGVSIGVGFLTAGLGVAALGGVSLNTAFSAIAGVGGFSLSSLGVIVSGAGFGFGSAFSNATLGGQGIGEAFSAGLTEGFWGALSAGLANQIGGFAATANIGQPAKAGGKIVAHGIVQGTLTLAKKGQFEHGFLAGALGETGSYAGPIGSILAGGTAAKLGGGKFANGAVTAGFVYLYNTAQHKDLIFGTRDIAVSVTKDYPPGTVGFAVHKAAKLLYWSIGSFASGEIGLHYSDTATQGYLAMADTDANIQFFAWRETLWWQQQEGLPGIFGRSVSAVTRAGILMWMRPPRMDVNIPTWRTNPDYLSCQIYRCN